MEILTLLRVTLAKNKSQYYILQIYQFALPKIGRHSLKCITSVKICQNFSIDADAVSTGLHKLK